MGKPIDNTSTLYTLSFVSHQVVIMQDMTRKLIEEYEKWDLEVNIQKTEYMCIGGQQQDLLLSGGQNLPMKISKDMGHLMKLSWEEILKEDEQFQFWEAFCEINAWQKKIKEELYNSISKSIVTYSCENWSIKEKTERMLIATRMDFQISQ